MAQQTRWNAVAYEYAKQTALLVCLVAHFRLHEKCAISMPSVAKVQSMVLSAFLILFNH